MTSINIKEAIKTALALVIAYAIALSQDWYDPAWSGFAVAMVAMPMFNVEQSFKKALLRLSGTIPGSIGGLLMISIAPQSRFLFITCVLIWLFISTYLMLSDTKRNYFWNVIGFTMLIISSTGAESASTAFDHALYRILENVTGISVYTLVSLLIWPNYKNNTIADSLRKVLGSINDSLNYLEFSRKYNDFTITFYQKISILDENITSFQNDIDENFFDENIKSSNKDIWNNTSQTFQDISLSITNINILKKDLYHQHRGLLEEDIKLLTKEVIHRVKEIKLLIYNKEVVAKKVMPSIDFQRYSDQVNELEKRFLDALDLEYKRLFNQLDKIEDNLCQILTLKEKTKPETSRFRFNLVLDRDYFQKTIFAVSAVFSSYLIWLFFDPPGHNQWYVMAGVNGMAMANLTSLKAKDFLPPTYIMCIVITVFYTILMPLSSNFAYFALLLFVYTFIQHFYLKGMAYITASIGLMSLGVASQQQYDFSQLVNGFLFDIMYMMFLIGAGYLMSSTRPEKKFLKSIERFFKSTQYLYGNNKGKRNKLYKNLLLQDVKTIPLLLKEYLNEIDYSFFNQVDKKQLEDLSLMVFRISKRLHLILEHQNVNSSNFAVKSETKSLIASVNQELLKISKGKECDTDFINQKIKEIYEGVKTEKVETVSETYKFLNSFKIFYEAMHGYHDIRKNIHLFSLKEERFS